MILALNYDKLKPYILVFLTGILAFFAGEGLFKVMAERTLGSVLRHNLMPLVVMGIILGFCNEGFISNLLSLKGIGSISKKTGIIIILLAMSIGIVIFNNPRLDIIYWSIILLIMLSLGFSIYYILFDKSFYAFCLFWCVYPFIYYMQNEVRKWGINVVIFDDLSMPFVSIYILAVFLTMILSNLKRTNLFFNKNLRFVYLFALLSIPSIFFSANPAKSFMFFVFDMVTPISYVIIMVVAIKDEKQAEKAIQFLLFSLFIFIGLTLYFYGWKGNKKLILNIYEAQTAIIAPVTLSSLAAILLPFSLMFYEAKKSIWYLILTVLFILLIIMSSFRTAVVGLLIVIVMRYMLSKIPWIKKVCGMVFIVAILAGLFFLLCHFETKINIENRILAKSLLIVKGASLNEITSGRLEIWKSAIDMIKDHPFMGIGAGMWKDNAFLYKSKEYYSYYPGYGYSFYYAADPHNLFLDIYLKYGLFAFLFFIYLVLYSIKRSYLVYKKETNEPTKAIIMGLHISLLVWLFVSNFDYVFYDYDLGNILPGLLFWSLVGLFFTYIKVKKGPKTEVSGVQNV